MKKFRIGDYAYPRDNSYSYTIGEEKSKPYLAGTHNTPAKKVRVVSLPYYKGTGDVHFPGTLEFVTVFYDGKCHVVLNNLSGNQPYDPYNPYDPCENCPLKKIL